MSDLGLDNGRRLGPTEAPSIEETGIDLNKTSLNPIEDRVSAGVRHQGDSAWWADQVLVPAERSYSIKATVTSDGGSTEEQINVTSDFRGINQVGEEEYHRTLASMRSNGASDAEAYAAAADIRNRVTAVGGTQYERSREAFQAELAAELAEESARTILDVPLGQGLDEPRADVQSEPLESGNQSALLRDIEERSDARSPAAAIEQQLEIVRALKSRRSENLGGRELTQVALGAREEDALTF